MVKRQIGGPRFASDATLAHLKHMGTGRKIGWAIRKLREAQDRTLLEIASEIDWDATNLSRVERGLQRVTDDRLQRIAGALHVSVSHLWQLAETRDQLTEDTGRMLALSGLLKPKAREQLLEYADFLLERQTD